MMPSWGYARGTAWTDKRGYRATYQSDTSDICAETRLRCSLLRRNRLKAPNADVLVVQTRAEQYFRLTFIYGSRLRTEFDARSFQI